MEFYPGVFEFDDPNDEWFGQFIWQRTPDRLFAIADYLGVSVRHTNGGQKPLLDVVNNHGVGINHPHCLAQTHTLMERGFDLIAPELMPFFHDGYLPDGESWSDTSTFHVSYFGSDANVQAYYPNISGQLLEEASPSCQGLTFMPVQTRPQGAWMTAGIPDSAYYDPAALSGTGGGGKRWTSSTFYDRYIGIYASPWEEEDREISLPSLAGQFNSAIERHILETHDNVNAWGILHHVVNVMWADLSGLSDNWDLELVFLRDIADGHADGVIDPPRPDLVQFVTMQELKQIYDDEVVGTTSSVIPKPLEDVMVFPNPSAGAVSMSFNLSKRSSVSLGVYNVEGELVYHLDLGIKGTGRYRMSWDGCAGSRIPLPSGTYFCELRTTSATTSNRLILFR
jgi:hypothetical protein